MEVTSSANGFVLHIAADVDGLREDYTVAAMPLGNGSMRVEPICGSSSPFSGSSDAGSGASEVSFSVVQEPGQARQVYFYMPHPAAGGSREVRLTAR